MPEAAAPKLSPPDPQLPTRNLAKSAWMTVLGAIVVGIMGIVNFRTRRDGGGDARP